MNKRPDMDLLALAGMTKAGLRDIDKTSVGSTPHADKINLRQMAGMDRSKRGNGNTPNMLKGLDFIDAPKSRPLGQVSMEGDALPPPPNRPVDFVPIPADLETNVMGMLEHADSEVVSTPEKVANPISNVTPDMDFDLFQFTILKEIVSTLNINIDSMENSLETLKSKRDMIMALIKGEKHDD